MSKALVPVLALAALASGTFAWFQMSAANEWQEKFDAVSAQVANQEKSVKDALARLSEATAELAQLKEDNLRLKKERDEAKAKNAGLTATGSAAPAAPGGDPAKPPAGDMRNVFQAFAKQMDDPEVRKTMKAGQERMIAGAYEALFKKLDLSEQDAKLVAELLADRNITALDQGRKLLNGKSDEASVLAVRKEIEATKAESDAKLKGMLGDAKYGELTTFEQTVGDQRALDSVARNFERKSMPLQPDQRTALSNIMREERLKNPSNEIPDLGGGPGMTMLMSDSEVKAQQQQEESYQTNVMNRAGQAGLSPDQVNGLRDSFAERNQRRAMGRVMGRAFLGGGGGR